MDFNRRNFLKVATATLAAGGVGSAGAAPSGHALNAAPWLDADVVVSGEVRAELVKRGVSL